MESGFDKIVLSLSAKQSAHSYRKMLAKRIREITIISPEEN